MKWSPLTLGGLSLALCLVVAAPAAEKSAGRPMKKPVFDPSARQVDLFDGMDAKDLKVKLVLKNALGGNLLIENTSDEPITVKMPKSLVGVHVNAQFGGGGGGLGGGGGGLGGGGGGQAVGGGGGGLGGGGGGLGGGGGGGFFSVPAKKTISVAMNTVCLEHGKKEPYSRLDYTVIPTETFASDPQLERLCEVVATGKVDAQVAQAAAWHLSNRMSWQQLASKNVNHIGRGSTPYFTMEQLQAADRLVATLKAEAIENGTYERVQPTRSGRQTN